MAVFIIAIVSVLMVLAGGLGASGNGAATSPSAVASSPLVASSEPAAPSTSPSAPPATPAEDRPQVKELFSSRHWTKGSQMWLGVGVLPLASDRCAVHAYTVEGKTRGAYRANCSDWASSGKDLLFFYVALKNVSERTRPFDLRNFVLVSRDGRSFGPVNVRSEADSPPNFLPETGKVVPHSRLVGYLTFDGRVTGMVPARLSYVDGKQTLTVVFDGKHVIYP